MCAGHCNDCAQPFRFTLIHTGFNETAYAYCDRCGTTALISFYSKRIPPEVADELIYGQIRWRLERFLAPCPCGGHFTAKASPRCSRCGAELSAEGMRDAIESQVPGTSQGWRWQGNWSGLYAIVIDERSVSI